MQVTVCPEAEHDQPSPDDDTNDDPAGRVSTTVISPASSMAPTLLADKVHTPCSPSANDPDPDLANARSTGVTPMGVVLVLFAGLESGVPDATVADTG